MINSRLILKRLLENNIIDASDKFKSRKIDKLPIKKGQVNKFDHKPETPNFHREIFYDAMNSKNPFDEVHSDFNSLSEFIEAAHYLSKHGTDEEKHRILDAMEKHKIGLSDDTISNLKIYGNREHVTRLNRILR